MNRATAIEFLNRMRIIAKKLQHPTALAAEWSALHDCYILATTMPFEDMVWMFDIEIDPTLRPTLLRLDRKNFKVRMNPLLFVRYQIAMFDAGVIPVPATRKLATILALLIESEQLLNIPSLEETHGPKSSNPETDDTRSR